MRKNFFLRILLIFLVSLFSLVLLFVLFRWTLSVKSNLREKELRGALENVVEQYGEKGLLEMAGVPVNDIYYSEDGVTLFEGNNGNWTYSADELENISVFEKCNEAVVYIKTDIDNSVSSFLDVNVKSGVGSGFFFTEDGYIITNEHVIKNASSITISLSDASEYEAQIIGTDSENDIAVLKIDADKTFPFLSFGDSDSLKVGQKVLAIGNPFGFDRSMVKGIISGLSRPIRNENGGILLGMIQTDAPVNPGNSGGPLLDTKGRVIGINTSIYSTNGTNQGMSFAVDGNTANRSAQDLIKYSKVYRGWIDIVPVQVSSSIVEYANLKVNHGILVSQVVPLGKADKAGLKGGKELVRYGNSMIYIGGDVITSINGVSVSEYGDLFTALGNTRPGDKVPVVINRDGKEITLKIELVERNAENVGWINR